MTPRVASAYNRPEDRIFPRTQSRQMADAKWDRGESWWRSSLAGLALLVFIVSCFVVFG